ncbi:MAG: helicase-associated domain-containing protein [Anaerolineae bacterium]
MMAHSSRTKDLYRALYEHPDELLRGIASFWKLHLLGGQKEDWARHLAESMQVARRLDTVAAMLSPDARALLAEVAGQDGIVPAHRLVGDYGSPRRLGPAALRREAPWQNPQNALEELYFRGLLYRTYADLGGKAVEAFHVPEPLLSLVRELPLERRRVELRTLDGVPDVVLRDDAATAEEDLLALLVHLRNRAPRIPEGGDMRNLLSSTLSSLDAQGRLAGEGNPQRLAFLAAMVHGAGLARQRGKIVAPSPDARIWLRASRSERYRTLYQAWRRATVWDELAWAGLVSLDDRGAQDMLSARTVVMRVLAQAPLDTWISLPSLVHVIKRTRPDLVRVDGDYDAWQLRDGGSDQLLSGYEQWDRIEGSIVTAMVTGPLYWLGIVALGSDRGANCSSFYLLGERASYWRPGQGPEPSVRSTSGVAEVTEDGRVRIPVAGTLYTRYQLERFAAWEAQAERAIYRVTEQSVAAGYRSGVRAEQMTSFLQRISGDAVPQSLLARLLAWGGRFGRVWACSRVLIETVDKATMRELRTDPEIKPHLDMAVDSTHHLVRERDAEALFAKLRARGIWVQIVADSD